MAELIHLKRDGVSVIFETNAGTPQIVHWGRAIDGPVDADSLLLSQVEPSPPCDFDYPQTIGIWRENARGFLSTPALIGSRDGLDFTQLFALRETVRHDDFSVSFVSVDAEAQLEVAARFELGVSGLLSVALSVTNLGLAPFKLDALAAYLPVPDYVTDTLDFTGRWMNERQPQRHQIQVGHFVREGREGRTGHDYTLAQFALASGSDFERGEAWGLSLAWSGNNRHVIERTPLGRTALGASELLLPGEIVLESNQTYTAPTVLGVYSNEGIDGASDRFHRAQRARAKHPTNVRPRPVTLNVWEAVYFDHDLEKLSALADAAASIGVERFVLDDGWFGARRDDYAGLGDWVVSEDVWPNGLKPLIDKVKSAGLEFGLWFEGEMVNPNSDLYRAHPDWILGAGGRVPPEFRMQQVLDLTNEGAYRHVFEQTNAILDEYDIAYIKWDHNRVLTEAAHLGKPAVHTQTEAIYRLFDELKAAHPGLEIESCASGGGRIDLGMVEHADRFWTSDNNDALERQSIQRYTSIVIAPELLGTHIGPTKAHSTGRTLSVSFRGATALWGHAGLEWDLTQASESELDELRSWISYYKANRAFLHSGRTIRQEPQEPNAWVHGVASHDKSRATYVYAQLRPSRYSRPANIRLTGLDATALYEVKVVAPAGLPANLHIRGPRWFDGVRINGAMLASVGLKSPVLKPEQAILIEAVRV